MNPLKYKSNSNFKAGEFLIDNKYFTQSIHCFYYSCFQMMIHIRENEPELKDYYNKRFSEGITEFSHQNLITTFFVNLSSIDDVDAKSFSTNIKKLRVLRNQADYYNIILKEEASTNAKKFANEILDILQRKYKTEDYE